MAASKLSTVGRFAGFWCCSVKNATASYAHAKSKLATTVAWIALVAVSGFIGFAPQFLVPLADALASSNSSIIKWYAGHPWQVSVISFLFWVFAIGSYITWDNADLARQKVEREMNDIKSEDSERRRQLEESQIRELNRPSDPFRSNSPF